LFICRLLNHKISHPNRGSCSFVPRARANSRYLNGRRRFETKRGSTSLPTSLTGDVTYELAEDDCERSWMTVSAERTTIILHSLACDTDETKRWLSRSEKGRLNPCFGPHLRYQDLSTRHDWPVKNAIVDLPISMEENSKLTSCNFVESIRGTERGSWRCSADVTNRG